MKILRWTLKLHKWIALIVGLQIFIWVGTGLYFTIFPIDEIRGNHKKTEWTVAPFKADQVIPLKDALAKAEAQTVKEAQLGHMMGRPVWRLTLPVSNEPDSEKIVTIDGRSGRVLSPIPEALANQIAKADYSGPGKLVAMEYLEKSPQEAGAGGKPIWAASFDDGESTVLYIEPDSAIVKSSRSTKWRIFDFFWKLHIMDYDDGENFNHPLIIIAALAALSVVLSGFTLLFFRIRRFILVRRKPK